LHPLSLPPGSWFIVHFILGGGCMHRYQGFFWMIFIFSFGFQGMAKKHVEKEEELESSEHAEALMAELDYQVFSKKKKCVFVCVANMLRRS